MKVLYALQGTGNGHVARAREIVPILASRCDLDVLVAGTQSQIALEYPIRFKKFGLTMKYNSSGGVSYWKSLFGNKPLRFIRDVYTLPVKGYDLVIIDFEAITSYACLLRGVKSLQLSHQAAYWSSRTPRPPRSVWLWEFILRYMSPSAFKIGFHFSAYDSFILPPIIRGDVRKLTPVNGDHYVVYLPAYSATTLAHWFQQFPDEQFVIFSRDEVIIDTLNTTFLSINNKLFTDSLAKSKGLICSAGFEGPSEAIFLGKKVLLSPISGQYEQAANAVCAEREGAMVFYQLNALAVDIFKRFFISENSVKRAWPDYTEDLVEGILARAKNGEDLDDISTLQLH